MIWKALAALYIKFPFIASFITKLRIVYTDKVDRAGVSKTTLYINRDFAEKLSLQDFTFVLAHEALHIVFNDLRRYEQLDKKSKMIWNVACDVVNNEMLVRDVGLQTDLEIVRYKHISRFANFNNGSKELIYKELLENCEMIEVDSDMLDEELEGEVVQEGQLDGSEESLKKALAEAYTESKMIGKVPEAIERMVEEILKPKTRLKELLRLHAGIKHIESNWKRRSRRTGTFPGTKRQQLEEIAVAIDTSGSITDKELQTFYSEIYELLKFANVELWFFDVKAYGPYKLVKPNELLKIKPIGGGGTCLDDLLSKVRRRKIILLTDGYVALDNFSLTKGKEIICVTTGKKLDYAKVNIRIQ